MKTRIDKIEAEVVRHLERTGTKPNDDYVRMLYGLAHPEQPKAQDDEVELWACECIDKHDGK